MPETKTVKLFSQEWCDDALRAVTATADSDDVFRLLKDGATFTHVLAFECTDHKELICHLEYVQGRVRSCTPGSFDESDVWARFKGTVAAWREAIEGGTPGSHLLMAAKLKLTKGRMKDAIENADAFNRLLRCLGGVATDWGV